MERSQMSVMNDFIKTYQSAQFDSILHDEFEQLKYLTNEIRHYKTKTTNEGERELNRKKNRYRDILPYDESRVILNNSFDNDSKLNINSDYINASFVQSAFDGHYSYIASQGPNKETSLDFIKMLYQYNIKIVICACNEYEGQKLKCHRYWTDKMNESFCFHKNYSVSLKSKPIHLDGCIIRELIVRYNNTSSMSESSSNSSLESNDLNEFEFTQFHITNWPDHGVPDDVESIIKMLNIVRQKIYENNKLINENLFIKNYENNKNFMRSKRFNKIPLSNEYLTVHCSAGCGRTGTIIAIDQVWTLLNENKLTSDFSMYSIARLLREQRIAMIQTLSQYTLFAKAIFYLFEKKLKLSLNDASDANQKFRNRLQSKMNNYDNYPSPEYENEPSFLSKSTPHSIVNSPYESPHQPQILQSHSNILNRSENFYNNINDDKVKMRKNLQTQHSKNKNNLNSRRSFIIDSNINNNSYNHNLVINEENIQQDRTSDINNFEPPTPPTPPYNIRNNNNANKRSAFSSVKNHNNNESNISNSFDDSRIINSPKPRFYSPHLLQVFANKTQNIDNSNSTNDPVNFSSNTPNITSTSSSSSSSSNFLSNKNKSNSINENNKDNTEYYSNSKNESDLLYANSSKLFLTNLTTKQQNLLRSAKMNVTPTTTSIDSKYTKNDGPLSNQLGNDRDNLRPHASANDMISPRSNVTSPLNFYPKKLFHQPNSLDGESRLPETLSMNSSLYLENSGSSTDASTGTGRINADLNTDSTKNCSELYLNDESMYKKEAGSVCEFLSNRLDTKNSRQVRSQSPKPNPQSPSITSLDATTSLNSSCVNSPPETPTVTPKNKFKITHNQAKVGMSKQVDLRRTNPPMKADLYENLNKVEKLNEPFMNQNNFEPEPPKPPVRRSKKLNQGLKQFDNQNNLKVETNFNKGRINTNVNTFSNDKNDESIVLTKSNTVVYRNRSNSSTQYDNNSNNGEYTERIGQFQKVGSIKQKSCDQGLLKSKTTKQVDQNNNVNEQNVRNGLYIDLNVIKELRSKKTKPQFKLKSQKFSEKHINQTLPSRRFQPPNYHEFNSQNNNEQIEMINKTDENPKNNNNNFKQRFKQAPGQYENFNNINNNMDNPMKQNLDGIKNERILANKIRNSNPINNQVHINQHFYVKNKLYNLNEQNSKHFFEKAHAQTNRFEDLYDNPYVTFNGNNGTKSKNELSHRNSELIEHKRRSAHLFNL